MSNGPLDGVRVIDLTGDLGRFGAKVLADCGAEVCRPVGAGSRGAPMTSEVASRHGGLLDWWYDGRKTPVALDLTTPEGRDQYRALAASADLVIESQPVGFLAEHGIDHEHLVAGNPGNSGNSGNPRLTQVSLTPFGRTGPWAGWQASDLVSAAFGGVLSVTGLPDQPLNSWGWQSYNFGGMAAAICGLAGVWSARRRGRGQLIDLSLHEVVTSSLEHIFMQYFYDELMDLPKVSERQGSLAWIRLYLATPARTGHVMVTPTPQPAPLIDWMLEQGVAEAAPFAGMSVEEVVEHREELMSAVQAFARTDDAGALWTEAQRRHVAFGEVQSVAQVAGNPQLADRHFFTSTELDDGSTVTGPSRLVHFSGTPVVPPAPPPPPANPADVAARWAIARSSPSASPDPGAPATAPSSQPTAAGTAAKPLAGLVIADFSWVLAGPFATRLLGDLGADVIKVQTEERATFVNRPDYPYYPVWNRSKRSATLNLKHPDGPAMARKLIERADVMIENYAAGVLDRLGLGWETVSKWNDQLVYISMSGCGHDGPWKDIITYAPTIHALCGLTHLTNPPDRGDVGPGFSLNDHAAGFAAAISILSAVESRHRTGQGQYIDMAQLEVGAYIVGPSLVDYLTNGRVAQPQGNVDALAGMVPNEVYRCRDGGWLAITATDDEMWSRLAALTGLDPHRWPAADARQAARREIDAALADWCGRQEATTAMERLQASGVAAGVIQNVEDLAERDPQLRARRFWLTGESDAYGTRPHDRFPALWSESDLEPYRLAPEYLGESNFEVWTDIAGLGAADVAEGIADDLFI